MTRDKIKEVYQGIQDEFASLDDRRAKLAHDLELLQSFCRHEMSEAQGDAQLCLVCGANFTLTGWTSNPPARTGR